MTDTDVSGREPTREEIIAFLNGEGMLEDCWFGEKHPSHSGYFWWRKYLNRLRSPGGDGGLVAALRDMPCIRPCNGRPDDFTVGQCCDAGECGCGNAAALSAAEATPAPVSWERGVAISEALSFFASAIKSGEGWTATCETALRTAQAELAALRTPHVAPGEEELVLLMRQNLSVDVSNYGLSADIEGIEDAARAILSRLTASREDVKNG